MIHNFKRFQIKWEYWTHVDENVRLAGLGFPQQPLDTLPPPPLRKVYKNSCVSVSNLILHMDLISVVWWVLIARACEIICPYENECSTDLLNISLSDREEIRSAAGCSLACIMIIHFLLAMHFKILAHRSRVLSLMELIPEKDFLFGHFCIRLNFYIMMPGLAPMRLV